MTKRDMEDSLYGSRQVGFGIDDVVIGQVLYSSKERCPVLVVSKSGPAFGDGGYVGVRRWIATRNTFSAHSLSDHVRNLWQHAAPSHAARMTAAVEAARSPAKSWDARVVSRGDRR